MITDSYLQQLARRIDGDRKAMRKTLDILHAMIDRKLWKQMEQNVELPSDFKQIEELFEKNNIFFRHITLSDGWWSRCTGHMLGFMAGDDTPVLLIPGFTDYTFIHPKTGENMRASKNAHLLEKDAVIACQPFSDGELTVKEVLRYGVSRLCKYDFIYSLVACVSIMMLTMFMPYVCKLIFSEVIPSGDATQLVPIAARNLVVMRIKDKVEYGLQTALMSRLLLLPASFAKQFSPGDLSNRLLTLSRISSTLTADFLSAILTFLFSGIMFVQFFIYGGPLFYTGVLVIAILIGAISVECYYANKVQKNVNPNASRLIRVPGPPSVGKGLRTLRNVRQPPASGQYVCVQCQLLRQIPAHDCDHGGGLALWAGALRLYCLLFCSCDCHSGRSPGAAYRKTGVTPVAGDKTLPSHL